MTDDGSGAGKDDHSLGHIGSLGNEDSQGALDGINNANGNASPVAQFAEGIGGAYILITHSPDVIASQNAPGDIGGGDRTEEITYGYY